MAGVLKTVTANAKTDAKDKQDFEDYLAYQDYLASQGDPEYGGVGETIEKVANQGALAKTMRGLDYDRAATGGPALASLLEKWAGKSIIKPGEYENALKLEGDYPSTSEMLDRAGYLQDSPWTRGALGFVGDVATSPSTYLSGGLSLLAKAGKGGKFVKYANKAANPLEAIMKSRGKKLYKKAFEELDMEATKRGKKLLPSTILQEEKFVGDAGKAADKLREVNRAAGDEIGETLTEAAAKGAGVDPFDVVKDSWGRIQELRGKGLPEADKLADQIEERVLKMWRTHGQNIPVDEANDIKAFINRQIKSSGYLAGDEAALTKQAQMQVAGELADKIPGAVEKVDKSLAQRLREASKRYASTDDSMLGKATGIAKRSSERNSIFSPTAVDAMLAGGGGMYGWAGGDPALALAPLLLKKGAQFGRSTLGRTVRAQTADKLSKSVILDPLARRSVWSMMLDEE